MTIGALLQDFPLPRVEAEVLVASALGVARTWVLAHGEKPLTPLEEERVQQVLHRRATGEPVAYITGEREFYGRTFAVTPAVLIPRPSTEHLVDLACAYMEHPRDEHREVDANISVVARVLRPHHSLSTIVDCGTGSGCIVITLALELPALRFVATDVSEAALNVARRNAMTYDVSKRIQFLSGDGLAPVRHISEPFLLVTNPPYVPASARLPREVVAYEPASALFAGEDGLSILRPLLSQARAHPQCAGIIFECQEDQLKALGIV